MRPIFKRLAVGLALVAIAAGLTACSGSPAVEATTTPASVHVPGSSAPASAEPDGAASTCAAMSVLNDFISNAAIEHGQGTLTDGQYAAVLHFVPSALNTISAAPQDGLHDRVSALTKSIATSPPTVPGALFEPMHSDFESAMSAMARACKAHGHDVIMFSTTGGG